jgi:putative DNA primase/helicase
VLLHLAGNRYECPVCEHGNLILYGQDAFDCKNGCDNTAVVLKIGDKLGLRDKAKTQATMAKVVGPGLTVAQYAEAKMLPADWLQNFFLLSDGKFQSVPAVAFHYGTTVRRYRNSKGVIACDNLNVKWRWGMGAHERRWQKGADGKSLYGQGQLAYSLRQTDNPPEHCFIVEGESDTQTMMWNGFHTLGVSGTAGWKTEYAQHPLLRGKSIFVIQEPEPAAEKLVQSIVASFPAGMVHPIRLPEKDASSLWLKHWAAFGAFDENLVLDAFKEDITSAVTAATVGKPQRKIELVCADDVVMKLTRWLWKDHVPLHHVTVFAGMPQKGKSTAAIDVIAKLTTGTDFPRMPNTMEPSEVIILASEDDADTTLKPRLNAAGADTKKVFFAKHSTVDGTEAWDIALDRDEQLLKDMLTARPNVKLIVIDPVTSYIGDVDPNKPKEVRPFLNKLKAFAKEMDISILIIMHLSKNPDVSALHRVGGAATWIEVPRSVWFFDAKQTDAQNEDACPLTYVMVNGKLNLVADDRKKSLEYQFAGVNIEIEGQQESIGRIKWGNESNLTLEQQFKRNRDKPGPEPKKINAAKAWLQDYLAAGEKFAKDVEADGKIAGHTEDALKEAKSRLGVVSRREFPNRGRWLWSLTEDVSVHEESQVY